MTEVGFIEAHGAGGSPDGLVAPDGLVEFKCHKAEVHKLIQMTGDLGVKLTQPQGLMWVADRAWCDVVHFNPTLAPVVLRVMRDEDFIGALAAAVLGFTNDLAAALAEIEPVAF